MSSWSRTDAFASWNVVASLFSDDLPYAKDLPLGKNPASLAPPTPTTSKWLRTRYVFPVWHSLLVKQTRGRTSPLGLGPKRLTDLWLESVKTEQGFLKYLEPVVSFYKSTPAVQTCTECEKQLSISRFVFAPSLAPPRRALTACIWHKKLQSPTPRHYVMMTPAR